MSDDKRRNQKNSRESVNIKFARSLRAKDLNTLIQHELLKARSNNLKEASVPTTLLHEIKFRLRYYSELYGENIDRKKFFSEVYVYEDEDEDEGDQQ